ncbi:MAG: dipeptidase [Sphingomonadales bacterium]
MIQKALIAATCLLIAACGNDEVKEEVIDLDARAVEIAQSSIIVDTHVDVPYRMTDTLEDVSVATEGGDFDYPRALAGALNAPFMSIYTPAAMEEAGGSKELAERLIDMVEAIAAKDPDKFAVAYTVADVRKHFEEGRISLPMGMENGSPIEGDLENLRHFYERGIRYITLAHSKSNHISDSSYDENKHWKGLSPFGEEVVVAMNNLGIMVDISHVSDQAFYDVMEITAVPVIASHSSARAFTPGWERNMDDAMIKRLGANGGAIMINFGSAFLTKEANVASYAAFDAYEKHLKDNGLTEADLSSSDFTKDYRKANPFPYADLADVLDHIDHVVKIAGVDHVGIGSDYDGVGDSLPKGLKDVSQYPNLVRGLLERGYSEEDIRKILGENLLRVWLEVEAYAAKQTKAAAEAAGR